VKIVNTIFEEMMRRWHGATAWSCAASGYSPCE
jgi:hypothetical protein